MLVIGLTGSLATGKSTVAAAFKKLGARTINADELVHTLIAPGGKCYRRVIRVFGKTILAEGRIDRKKLATIVFKYPAELRKLERIIHPAVGLRIKEELRRYRNSDQRVILEVPLLFESGLNRLADVVVVVKCDRQSQIRRAMKGFGMRRAEALKRINAQMPLRKKIRMADFIIDNNGTKKQTEKQVKQLWQKL